MSDEVKVIEEKECFCKNKWFRKFLVTAIGTFVGVYGALSLFAAIHKPPMPPCPMRFGAPMMHYGMNCPFKKHPKFHKEFKAQKGQAPFEAKREIDD